MRAPEDDTESAFFTERTKISYLVTNFHELTPEKVGRCFEPLGAPLQLVRALRIESSDGGALPPLVVAVQLNVVSGMPGHGQSASYEDIAAALSSGSSPSSVASTRPASRPR